MQMNLSIMACTHNGTAVSRCCATEKTALTLSKPFDLSDTQVDSVNNVYSTATQSNENKYYFDVGITSVIYAENEIKT